MPVSADMMTLERIDGIFITFTELPGFQINWLLMNKRYSLIVRQLGR